MTGRSFTVHERYRWRTNNDYNKDGVLRLTTIYNIERNNSKLLILLLVEQSISEIHAAHL